MQQLIPDNCPMITFTSGPTSLVSLDLRGKMTSLKNTKWKCYACIMQR